MSIRHLNKKAHMESDNIMTRNPLDVRVRYLLEPALRYAARLILTPLFFLFALGYKFLHSSRAEKCRAIVRDFQSLAGLKGRMERDKIFSSENQLPKAV